MSAFRSSLLAMTLSCGAAHAAALVPVPGLTLPLPAGALEPNRGQAKPEIVFLLRGISSGRAVTAQSVLYSPLGAQLTLLGSNTDPAVRFADPLPGVVNSLTGADPQKWVTGIPRFATAYFAQVYPGIDAEYTLDADGQLTLNFLCSPGADPKLIGFEIRKAAALVRFSNGSLRATLGFRLQTDPQLLYPPATAYQEGTSGRVSRNVNYAVQSTTRFALEIDGIDSTLPLRIEMKIGGNVNTVFPNGRFTGASQTTDAAGNTFAITAVPDAAGKDAPFPGYRWEGCSSDENFPAACSDAAVYKFSKAGQLVFVSYFAGTTRETASSVRLAPDGTLIVTGTTDSADFPVTPGALQPAYAGPAPVPSSGSMSAVGDLFAVRINAATGVPQASTFFGGPDPDIIGETALGADGSLYFLPKSIATSSKHMPVSRGALQTECEGSQCLNGYAAHLSASLDRMLYGTYLPGTVQAKAILHTDGSIYYAGSAGAGFPTTPTAYQRLPAGRDDGIVARLDPSGAKLLFATYLGGIDTDWILNMAVLPDGSVWAAVSSFVQCCTNISNRLVRLDSNGQRVLADKPIDVGDLAVDQAGNLFATADGNFTMGTDAFLANSCGGLAYLKLNANGEQLFGTYLPSGSEYSFDGTGDKGVPIVRIENQRYQVLEAQSMGVFTGCVVDAASFSRSDSISPGAIVTLFGSRMGPAVGIAFQLQDGRLPTTLGGTRVLVNGEPVPILLRRMGR